MISSRPEGNERTRCNRGCIENTNLCRSDGKRTGAVLEVKSTLRRRHLDETMVALVLMMALVAVLMRPLVLTTAL